MKNILIILGHPNSNSFCSALAEAHIDGATSSGAQVTMLRLGELDFDPILNMGYDEKQALEPDLQLAQQLIKEADHLVWVYPNWWGTVPALVKGFIDRVLLPEFAFSYESNTPIPQKLLKGKTARIVVTSDSPSWYYHLLVKAPGHHMMKTAVLGFTGISPVRISAFNQVRKSNDTKRSHWLKTVRHLGYQQR